MNHRAPSFLSVLLLESSFVQRPNFLQASRRAVFHYGLDALSFQLLQNEERFVSEPIELRFRVEERQCASHWL
jgi:hypothetical protein